MHNVTDSRPRVLHIGPSTVESRGGIATVISGFAQSPIVDKWYRQDVFASYMDGILWLRALFSAKQLIKFITCRDRYDICHIHMAANASVRRKLIYARIARNRGAKVIIEIHAGLFASFFNSVSARTQRSIVRELRKADALVALSPYWQSQFTELLGITGFQVVPNAVDTELYAQCYHDTQVPTTLLVLSHLRERKGTYDLIEAVAKVRDRCSDFTVILAGGDEVQKARKIIADRGLTGTIDAVGWVGPDEKLELLANADIIALPSHFEAFPVSLIEGMAAGKAVIATRVGGIPDLVDEEGGLLVTPQSPEELGRAIETLLHEPDTVRQMQHYNRAKAAQQFSQATVHARLVQLYDSVLAGD